MKKPKEENTKTTIRVPKQMWDKVRIRAIQESISAEALVVRALTQYLKGEVTDMRGNGRIFLARPDLLVRYSLYGKEFRESTKTAKTGHGTLEKAKRFLAERLKEVGARSNRRSDVRNTRKQTGHDCGVSGSTPHNTRTGRETLRTDRLASKTGRD